MLEIASLGEVHMQRDERHPAVLEHEKEMALIVLIMTVIDVMVTMVSDE